MIRRVRLYARLKQPENKYPRVPIDFDRSGRPIPVKGEVTNYYVRIAGKFIDAGENLTAAVSRMRTEQDRLRDGVRREEVDKALSFAAKPDSIPGRTRLSSAIADYKSELQTLDKSKLTVLAYTNTLDGFQSSCHKEFLEDIDRKDILTHIDWLRDNLKVRVRGSQNRTLRNRINYLGTFFAKHGIQLKKQQQTKDDKGLLFRSDVPKNMKVKPKKFDQSTIDTLLANADEDQRDYLELLLWSGFRDGEMQYLQFSDFNFRNGTVMVQAKPQYGWKPKDWEEREITLPSAVIKRIKERMDRPRQYQNVMRKAGENDLVFTSSVGRPDSRLIAMLHAAAKKAGMNLKGKRAGHLFRKTAGSRVAKAEGLPAAMEFLGHSNIETTALYLAADTADQKKRRQTVDAMYEQSGND
jgi:integrase